MIFGVQSTKLIRNTGMCRMALWMLSGYENQLVLYLHVLKAALLHKRQSVISLFMSYIA